MRENEMVVNEERKRKERERYGGEFEKKNKKKEISDILSDIPSRSLRSARALISLRIKYD